MAVKRQGLYLIAGLLVFGVIGFLWLRSTSTLFNLFFPPKDFYEPLVVVQMDTLQTEYELVSVHSYPGSYAVNLQASRPMANPMPAFGLGVHLAISPNDEVSGIAQTLEPWVAPYWGPDKGSGLILASFEAPEHIGRNEAARISVRFEGDLAEFNRSYGPLSLSVTKLSAEYEHNKPFKYAPPASLASLDKYCALAA